MEGKAQMAQGGERTLTFSLSGLMANLVLILIFQEIRYVHQSPMPALQRKDRYLALSKI